MAEKISRWSNTNRTIKKILWSILLLIAIFSGVYIYGEYFYTFSDGYRTGMLHKFSHQGNIIKTYEGEMILSNVEGQDVAITSEKFLFSVTSKTLANQLDTIQGQVVTVHYEQKHRALFLHGDSEYIVNSVKPIK